MEAIIFVGLQATGKSTFFREYFYHTHLRINLDMLKTRYRETIILKACLEAKQSFVVDNTNPTVENRKRYIHAAKQAGFRVVGYYFRSKLQEALAQNRQRTGEAYIPEQGIRATSMRLQIPSFSEGFDTIYDVIPEQGRFLIEDWKLNSSSSSP